MNDLRCGTCQALRATCVNPATCITSLAPPLGSLEDYERSHPLPLRFSLPGMIAVHRIAKKLQP